MFESIYTPAVMSRHSVKRLPVDTEQTGTPFQVLGEIRSLPGHMGLDAVIQCRIARRT